MVVVLLVVAFVFCQASRHLGRRSLLSQGVPLLFVDAACLLVCTHSRHCACLLLSWFLSYCGSDLDDVRLLDSLAFRSAQDVLERLAVALLVVLVFLVLLRLFLLLVFAPACAYCLACVCTACLYVCVYVCVCVSVSVYILVCACECACFYGTMCCSATSLPLEVANVALRSLGTFNPGWTLHLEVGAVGDLLLADTDGRTRHSGVGSFFQVILLVLPRHLKLPPRLEMGLRI